MTDTTAFVPATLLALILLVMCGRLLTEYASDIRSAQSQPKPKRNTKKATVSIIVQTHNNATDIAASLASIFRSSYHRYHVIIVDNASNDETLDIVQGFEKRYPRRLQRVVRRRDQKPVPWQKLVSRYTCGDVALVMATPHIIDVNALEHITTQFAANPLIGRLALYSRQAGTSWLGAATGSYASIWQRQIHKRLAARHKIAPEQESIFAVRRGRPSQLAAAYNTSAAAVRIGKSDQTYVLRLQLLPALFCVLLVYTIISRDTLLFLYGWSLFTTFMLLSVLGDTDLPLRHKASQLKHIVPAYMLFCCYQLIASGRRAFIWAQAKI